MRTYALSRAHAPRDHQPVDTRNCVHTRTHTRKHTIASTYAYDEWLSAVCFGGVVWWTSCEYVCFSALSQRFEAGPLPCTHACTCLDISIRGAPGIVPIIRVRACVRRLAERARTKQIARARAGSHFRRATELNCSPNSDSVCVCVCMCVQVNC